MAVSTPAFAFLMCAVVGRLSVKQSRKALCLGGSRAYQKSDRMCARQMRDVCDIYIEIDEVKMTDINVSTKGPLPSCS